MWLERPEWLNSLIFSCLSYVSPLKEEEKTESSWVGVNFLHSNPFWICDQKYQQDTGDLAIA